MQNTVLEVRDHDPARAGDRAGAQAGEGVAAEVARRSAADRLGHYTDEVRRLLDAALSIMERTGSIDPPVRDIVKAAGLSNQAFYRHFASKDALLVALLDDGRRRLVETLRRRLERAATPDARVRAWIDGVLAQCRAPQAAAATRPFVVNATRLAERYPVETAASTDRLLALLRDDVADELDARAVHELTMGTMHRHLLAGTVPSKREVDHLVAFALAGIHAHRGDEVSR